MKKFSIVIAIVLCIVLSAGLFVACQSHQHIFDEWGNDQSNHWTVCECGAKDETSVAPHNDSNKDHKCDQCKIVMSECADNDNDHLCDVCGKSLSGCADENNDHLCDICGATLSICADENKDHKCDKCEAVLSECKDENKDHQCDVCGKILSECQYSEKSHVCTICGKESECKDENKDHVCDICGKVLSECKDENNDHLCDVCDKILSECQYGENSHICTVCGKVSECVDENSDYICDVCGKEIEADHEHQLVFDPKFTNDTAPSSSADGKCHVSCSVSDCGFERDIVLKYLDIDVPVSVSAQEGEYVYFFMMSNWSTGMSVPDSAVISVGEGTTLEYVAYRYIGSGYKYEVESINEELVNGVYAFADEPSAILLRACASDGNISFALKSAPGSSQDNPINIEKNKEYKGSVTKDTWFKYTASADEEIVFCNPDGYDLSTTDSTPLTYAYNIISLKEGQSFFINKSYGGYGFKIIDKEEGKSYEGYSPYTAIEMESNPLGVKSTDGTMYYKYVMTEEGRLSIELNGVAVESIYSWQGTSVSVQYYESSYGYFYNYYDFPYLSVGDVIYINISGAQADGFKLEIKAKKLEAVDNTFVIKDSNGNALSNISVSIVDYDENEIGKGVTGEDGSVVINFMPGNYEIKLSGYDESLSYSGKSISWDADDSSTDKGQTYEIVLESPVNKTVFVKCGSEGISGVDVVVYTSYSQYSGSFSGEIARATTDENGKAVLEYLIPKQGANLYFRVENLSSNYTASHKKVSKSNIEDLTIEVTLPPKYTVSVVIPDELDINISDLSVSCSYIKYGWYGDAEEVVIASGKLSAEGIFEFYYTLSDMSDIDIKLSGLPFDLDGTGVIEYGSYTGEVTFSKASLETLVLGENEVKLDVDTETYLWPSIKYVFAVEKDGKYTISLEDGYGFAFVKNDKGSFVLSQNYDMLSYTFDAVAGDKMYFVASSNNSEANSVSYKLTIAEYVAPQIPALELGDNNINLEYDFTNGFAAQYMFSSESGGAYTITLKDSGVSALVEIGEDGYLTSDDYDPILSYTFVLGAGEYVIINVDSIDETAYSYSYVLNIQEVQVVTVLSEGDNLVNATYMGNTLTFTAEKTGNYILSSMDENYCVESSGEFVQKPIRFYLEAGKSISFCFSTYDYSDSDMYVVNIELLEEVKPNE